MCTIEEIVRDAIAPMAQVDVQTAARKALPTHDGEELSEQQPMDIYVPQAPFADSRLSQEIGPSKPSDGVNAIDEKSSAATTAQRALEREPESMAAKASKAAATALPDSDSEDDSQSDRETEQTEEDSTVKSIGDHARADEHSTLDSPRSAAQVANKAAATALPDSDEEADEDTESQASVSVPRLPSHSLSRAPRSRPDQVGSSAVLSQAAAESAVPGRRLGRLDSLSASDTESAEVQSRQGSAPQNVQQDRPAASPWTESFGAGKISALGTDAQSTSGGGATSPFGSSMLASGVSAASVPSSSAAPFGMSSTASIRPAVDSSTTALNSSMMPFGKGTPAPSPGVPSRGLMLGISKAAPTPTVAAPALPIARQGSGALPASDAAGSPRQPGALPQRQSSAALPPFSPLVSVHLPATLRQCMPEHSPFTSLIH